MPVNVLVCTNGRNGSEWFGRLLVERGFMKMREDYNPFHKFNNPKYRYNPGFRAWGQAAKKEKKDFVTKLMPWHFVWWGSPHHGYYGPKTGRKLVEENISWANMQKCLPYKKTAYIRLIRKDSFAVARSTKGAHKVQNWQISTQNVVSPDEITEKDVKLADLNNAWWDYILAGEDYHVVYYEDLKEDTVGEMKKVTDYIESVKRKK